MMIILRLGEEHLGDLLVKDFIHFFLKVCSEASYLLIICPLLKYANVLLLELINLKPDGFLIEYYISFFHELVDHWPLLFYLVPILLSHHVARCLIFGLVKLLTSPVE